jgi:dethiobiotin synthetase
LKYLVAGIGTGVGKTIVSSILVQALQADYWKPIQTGSEEDSDTQTVQNLVSCSSVFHPEAILLKKPFSPHYAAHLEGMDLQAFPIPNLPDSEKLIVEAAGGILVPLSETTLLADWVKHWNLPVILVSRHYLGSINHTLLSVEALRSRNIPIKGLVFNGKDEFGNESIIQRFTKLPIIGRVGEESDFYPELIQKYAKVFRENLI